MSHVVAFFDPFIYQPYVAVVADQDDLNKVMAALRQKYRTPLSYKFKFSDISAIRTRTKLAPVGSVTFYRGVQERTLGVYAVQLNKGIPVMMAR